MKACLHCTQEWHRNVSDISVTFKIGAARRSILRSRLWTKHLTDIVSVPVQGVSVYKIYEKIVFVDSTDKTKSY